ncbi:type IV toxin-antitoxin system AbiEi family antitoxin domain-containing protein [Nocardioides piscis]|uniref:Type IV toxin-antitoxin system AbiEi family antitoxin domain-containing protein n=1 Tax=Nocardioides piscis TaxID=2714938 RepID=A0A6G7YCN8_9ACTN|nr:type IV toxin-antitoxin system AbiEi family antitoxin domain-containing protein [Nocardioides piscis]QIK74377.1 type IV toxin-antitoxin system AbiEi family antitoxin domain-containing protein [Nocardioides piscis]
MTDDGFAELLDLQSGVISRRQVLALGLRPHDLKRMERQRELVRLHPRVYVNHTGEPTWLQRAWAGVLFAWPAALSHDSAIRAVDGPGRRGRSDSVIHLAIDRDRSLVLPPGLRLHRLAGFHGKVQWNASPPRVRLEEATIDVAAEAPDDFAAIAALAAAVQSRRTRADRLTTALAGRSRIARRDFMAGVLADIAAGTCSVLEQGYLDLVERPHGLPVASRQVRDSLSGPVYRDVVYDGLDQVVELDGRLFHDSADDRDADLERDLDAAVAGLATLRLGWGQVFRTGCRTGVRIGRLLRARGWTGQEHACPGCDDAWPMTG